MYELKRFTLNQNDISFLEQQVTFPTIHVVGYNASGDPLYGYSGSDGNVHMLGILGSFNPLDIPAGETRWYNGARDPIGLRDVSGHFNNLTQDGQAWGSFGQNFIRLTHSDYTHYVHQNLDNAALAGPGVPVGATPMTDSSSLYSDPTASLVDYTPG